MALWRSPGWGLRAWPVGGRRTQGALGGWEAPPGRWPREAWMMQLCLCQLSLCWDSWVPKNSRSPQPWRHHSTHGPRVVRGQMRLLSFCDITTGWVASRHIRAHTPREGVRSELHPQGVSSHGCPGRCGEHLRPGLFQLLSLCPSAPGLLRLQASNAPWGSRCHARPCLPLSPSLLCVSLRRTHCTQGPPGSSGTASPSPCPHLVTSAKSLWSHGPALVGSGHRDPVCLSHHSAQH